MSCTTVMLNQLKNKFKQQQGEFPKKSIYNN